MNNIKKKILLVLPLLVAGIFLLIAISIVPKATFENSKKMQGQLLEITEQGGPGDIVLKLKDDNVLYYVNRGTEKGLDVEVLKKQILNKEVTLFYADHWSLLDPDNSSRHLYRVESDGIVIFNEIEK